MPSLRVPHLPAEPVNSGSERQPRYIVGRRRQFHDRSRQRIRLCPPIIVPHAQCLMHVGQARRVHCCAQENELLLVEVHRQFFCSGEDPALRNKFGNWASGVGYFSTENASTFSIEPARASCALVAGAKRIAVSIVALENNRKNMNFLSGCSAQLYERVRNCLSTSFERASAQNSRRLLFKKPPVLLYLSWLFIFDTDCGVSQESVSISKDAVPLRLACANSEHFPRRRHVHGFPVSCGEITRPYSDARLRRSNI